MIGKVQGVGYRFFVVQTAKDCALTGWVRNCSNGDVEGEAEGTENDLKRFVSALKSGHPWARVDRLDQNEISEKNNEKGFNIEY